jgi:hypothetical protein
MPYPSQVSWYYDLSNICWKAPIIQFLIMQSSSLSHYLVTLMTKYLPQHLIILHCKPVFFPQCEKPSFTTIQNRQHNTHSSVHFNFCKHFREVNWRQKILHWMITSFLWDK